MEPQSPNPPEPPASATEPLPPPPGGWSNVTNPAPAGQPPGWGQPQSPPAGWQPQQPPQPQQGWVQQQPAPPGYQPQQVPPPGWGQPQQGWAPPGGMWVQMKQPVTGLAKIGALYLALLGLLIALLGAVFIIGGVVGGAALQDSITSNGLDSTLGNAVAGIAIVIGGFVLIIGVLHLLSGIFAWRGAGVARVLGVIFGLIFGGLGLVGALGSTANASTASAGVLTWAIVIGYLYTAVVFIFVWKQK